MTRKNFTVNFSLFLAAALLIISFSAPEVSEAKSKKDGSKRHHKAKTGKKSDTKKGWSHRDGGKKRAEKTDPEPNLNGTPVRQEPGETVKEYPLEKPIE